MHSSPPSQPIPRRSPSLAPAQRHALPEHFRSPTQSRRTPAGCAMHAPPTSQHLPRRRLLLAPAAPTHARRLRDAFSADRTTHSPPKTFARPRTATRPSRALPLPHAAPTHARRLRDARPPTSQHISRRRPAPVPAQRRALPEHFLTPFPHTSTPLAATMHARRPHNPFPTEDLRPSPQRHAASASVPLRTQKNGTAQWMCDAECLGRPSLRSVIWVGEPRAVRRRCGALAWRVGLRPQPWALRSRRCGRVLRA